MNDYAVEKPTGDDPPTFAVAHRRAIENAARNTRAVDAAGREFPHVRDDVDRNEDVGEADGSAGCGHAGSAGDSVATAIDPARSSEHAAPPAKTSSVSEEAART